jgi:hypothetical protein
LQRLKLWRRKVAATSITHGFSAAYQGEKFTRWTRCGIRNRLTAGEKEFPRLAKRYRKLYAHSAYLNGEYKNRMTKLLAELRTRYGLQGNYGEPPPTMRNPQLALPFETLDGSTAARRLLSPCN